MTTASRLSPVTVNRLSLYLRCLRCLDAAGIDKISSRELAERFHLSAAQIRKDLAYIGGLGVRGVGYDVRELSKQIAASLGLDRDQRLVIVGLGNLGRALDRYLAADDGHFRVVGLFDTDPSKVGTRVDGRPVLHTRQLDSVVRRSGATIAVLAVPEEVAQENYELVAAAGVKAVLNFAPTRLEPRDGVRVKDVDLRTHLEELGFFVIQDTLAGASESSVDDDHRSAGSPCI
jgi:redox-sensing transcriptional repressor